jgi:D-beta-D-heptose 7-phosphate kinase/D-beta-D-heptose 1-phosphate adenosyltransferase
LTQADKLDPARIDSLLARFDDLQLLVAGDVLLDEYLVGDVDRISPEAPVPVVRVRSESFALGGAGNVVRNVAALGARCTFCSSVGTDAEGDAVIALLEELGVATDGVARVAGRPTTRKSRVVARTQQIVRVDRETHEPVPPAVARRLVGVVADAAPDVDGAILEDYGKGLFTSATIRKLMQALAAAEVPVAVDPKGELAPFKGAALLKPNLREAQELSGIRLREPRDLDRVAKRLRSKIGGGAIAVTRGGEGMSLFGEDGPRIDVPTPTREVYDVQGAGDTTIAALVLSLRAGATLREAAVIANAAAGVVVGKVGTATASRDEVHAGLASAIAAAEAHS